VKPDSVVSIQIDPSTGYPAAPGCPKKQAELYIAGTEPKAYCPKHGGAGLGPAPPSPVPVPLQTNNPVASP